MNTPYSEEKANGKNVSLPYILQGSFSGIGST
jgi:hypothetical protein